MFPYQIADAAVKFGQMCEAVRRYYEKKLVLVEHEIQQKGARQ